MGALSEIKILEFGGVVAGPYCTKYFALMGAEVIRVETSKRLDITRVPRPGVMAHGVRLAPTDSIGSNENNLNKFGITLDLTKPEAVELAMRLVLRSNAVVESYRPGVMDKLGFGYPVLREIKPDIIMLSMSMAGSSGPEAQYSGYAPIFASLAGLGHLTGYQDGPATEIRMPIDIMAATTGAVALLAALLHQQQTGEGQYIDFSDREAVSCLIADSIVDYTMNGRERQREGNRDDVMAPHNCYRCKGEDKWVSIAIATEEEWKAFCEAIGNPEWTGDARFCDGLGRWQNQDELDNLIHEWTMEHSHYEVMDILQRAEVAAVPSFNAAELCSDPHLGPRYPLIVVDHPTLGAQTVFSPPWKLSLTPAEILTPGPTLGQHNEYVFGTLLGLSQQEIASLIEKEVIC